MYKRIYFLIANRPFSSGKIFIRNTSLPVCSKCLYFIRIMLELKHERTFEKKETPA